VVVLAQFVTLGTYEAGELPRAFAVAAGLVTSLVGPFLSFFVSLHVFRHRRTSKALDLASVGMTYVVTCISFAIIYAIVAQRDPHAFNLPPGDPILDFGTALYFSVITITTTGYGDIAPVSALARISACWEIATGLLYQVFIFSLVASLIAPHASDPAVNHRED
jgi:hypothetical protein